MSKGDVRRFGEQKDGRFRLNSSYDESEMYLIDRLSSACGVTPTRLQKEFVNLCLRNESAINYIQDKFIKRSRYRIIPTRIEGGEMKYIISDIL